MATINIIRPGLFTSIQDKGRWGYQKFGMSVGGVMDSFASRIANLLVNNYEYEGLFETTFSGIEMEFNCNEIISITGSNINPKINGKSVLMWTSLLVNKGDILSTSASLSGIRSYIAFSRGLDVPLIMGSKATYTRGKVGGFKGRKLKAGDQIKLGKKNLSSWGAYLPVRYIPKYMKEDIITLVLGPQDDYFNKEAIDTFLQSKYTISSDADRMGYRLDGPKVNHLKGPDIVSDGVVFGSVQIPGHGLPIVMMADRQTIGGYTKIGTVITPDLDKLGQMGPGGIIRFKAIGVEEANEIYRDNEKKIDHIKYVLKKNRFKFHSIRDFKLNINKNDFKAEIRELE